MADSQLTKTVFRGEDLTGRTFGKWTVISFDCRKGKQLVDYWICQCDCGNKKSAEELGIPRERLKCRLERGWSVETSLTSPPEMRGRHVRK